MNRALAFLGCLIFALPFLGCEQQNKKMSSQLQLKDGVQEKISDEVWDGNPSGNEVLPDFFGDQTSWGAFPESMVGVWEAKVEDSSRKWGIKFELDGSISKIIHPLAGPVDIAEGGVYLEGPEPDTYAVFVMGPCEARYIPKTHMLKVTIVVNQYEMKMPTNQIEGMIKDYLEGPIFENGKVWKTDWRNYTWVKGATPPPFDVIDANPEELIFEKVVISEKTNDN